MDDIGAADNVMVAQLTVKAGVRTLYARAGNMFARACVAGLASGIVTYVLQMFW
jgi:hypothetical protein